MVVATEAVMGAETEVETEALVAIMVAVLEMETRHKAASSLMIARSSLCTK